LARTHEDFEEHVALRTASDRKFGLGVGGILAAIGLARLLLHLPAVGVLAPAMIVVGLGLVALGLTADHLLAPLNRAWTRLGLVLFKVVSPVVLLLLYATVFVPVGALMRARGYDPMRRRREPGAASYWIVREPPGPPPETMVNQY
jgi:Saxitoxin biosynthesis operon protein SxtJ